MAHATEASGMGPAPNSISVPFVVLAAIVAMLGLFSLLYWVITFQWVFFLGVVPMTIGALMLFHPKAGSNRAPG
jgi:Na+/proline symporter